MIGLKKKREPNYGRMVINLCLGIYIAQAEDEEFSVVYAV